MDHALAANVSTLRTFNRSFTRRIGVLDDSFLQSGRPFAEARLLFEIGNDGASVLELRHRLGLDSGYLSRLLRELERNGLVTSVPDPADARRRLVRLTRSGRAAWTDLDRRSDRLAAGLIDSLSARQRQRLDDALRSADRLLRVAAIKFDVVDPRSEMALDAMNAYFAELAVRFPDGFEPGDTLTVDAPAMRPPTGAFVVARSDGAVAACGGVQRHDDATAEIKRMWVHPDWRGEGLGRRMLTDLEMQVATLGYAHVVLDTNDTLTEAISMYERAGYRSIERYNDNPYARRWFAKSLTAPGPLFCVTDLVVDDQIGDTERTRPPGDRDYGRRMALISVTELADQIDDPDLVVCDVRFYLADHDQGRREYDAGHIPGARFVDLHTDLAAATGGGRHPLPSVDEFADVLGRLGVEPGSIVVAYDSAGGATASRLWWMLRSIGHGRVAVLDGGLPAWVAAGHAVTTEIPEVSATEYPVAIEWTGVVDADAVAQSIEFGGTVIDARAAERFRGEVEPLDARAGHIPGAINRFHGGTLGPDGHHLPTPELVEYFAGIGANPIVYCGSGVTACHAILAMTEVGLTGARLYPGSWSEWSSDPQRPLATGD